MRRTKGFTLSELMVVVLIVIILAAIAYPSYREYVRRGQLAQARAQLMAAAQFMERTFTMTNSYALAAGGGAIALPAGLTQSPPPPQAAVYNINLATTATTYVLRAVPVAGRMMAGDRCGTLTLDQTGARGVEGGTPELSAACWER